MAINKKDVTLTAIDPNEVRDHISRGLRLVQIVAKGPNGIKVRQSESFLKRLTRATLRNTDQVRLFSRY